MEGLSEKICIEVTEKVFLGSTATHVSEALEQLHDLGVEIALDDFGTGFASLSHIKAFPIDRLKIDRSFVDDMDRNKDSLSIVQAIIQLSHSMGLAVTARAWKRKLSSSCSRAWAAAASRAISCHGRSMRKTQRANYRSNR